MHDIDVQNHGSLWVLVPRTDLGSVWLERNIAWEDGYQPYRPIAIVEPRYLPDVLDGAVEAGLRLRAC